MRTLSTRVIAKLADDRLMLPVFDTYAGSKRLVTAVVESPDGDPVRARGAKDVRIAALAHQRLLARGHTVHLVQVFDEDRTASRVDDVLAEVQSGALVIFFGRTEAECALLVDALGVATPVPGSLAVH